MKMATNTNQVPETSISTFVFLDFESTSLLDRKCRITELCLLAVNRVDMKDAGNFPRVTNKLTLCLDPQMPISMTSSNMTGLFNDSLEHQKALTDETVALINAFLNHLSKPVCLLAHNGNRFDFPLLVAELKRINQSLDSLLLCADTLEAFRSLDGLPAKYDPLTNLNSGTKNQNSPITSNVTPSKSVPSTSQSPMKRKGTTDLGVLNNQSPKVIRQDIEQLSIDMIEKAKKRLEFEEMKTDVKKEEEGDTEGKDEVVEEFSASLEDADYLLALENVENVLCAEKMVFGESCEENVIVCRIQKKVETESKFPAVSTTPSVSVKPCCVANGTGYYVRSNTDEMSNRKRIANESADTVGDQCQTNSGALPACLDKTKLQSWKPSGSVTKSKSSSNKLEEVNKTANQKHSTDTNFSVTMRPDINLAVCVQTTPTRTINDSPMTKVSISAHSKSSSSVSKPTHVLTSNATADATKTLPVISTTTALTSGCTPVAKACQIGVPDKSNNSGASRSTTPSSTNVSSTSNAGTTLISQTNVTTSVASRSASASVAYVPTTSNKDTVLASTSSMLGSALPSGANVLNLPESGLNLVAGTAVPNGSPAAGANGSPGFRRQSYKLGEIYFRKFGCKPPESHRAEDDCVTLVKIAKCSQGFMEWVDTNAALLSTVQAPF